VSTTFLDPFNAKAMTFREVASTFVPSPNFSLLAGKWNALLIGPRGSGKTTLMKMLSVESLRAWGGPNAAAFRDNVAFTGIYVPADIAWGEMVKALSATLDETTTNFVSAAAFVTNVLQSVVMAMQSRLNVAESQLPGADFRLAECSADRLEQAVIEIAQLWRLTIRSLSLQGLANALGHRLIDIKRQANLIAETPGLSLDDISKRMPYIGLPLVECVGEAVRYFDQAIGEESGLWALLLDEFEVAPVHLQQEVLTGLRASSSKVLFKVALAPCGPHTLLDINEATRPTPENDYKQVELWYVNRDAAEEFCGRLFESRRAKWQSVPPGASPEDVFGASGYAIVDEDGEASAIASYGRGALWEREFAQLAEKDSWFSAFLEQKGIDPKSLDPSPSAHNGNTIRKIAPVVAFRNAYRGKVEGKKRGRKPYNSAYSGWAAICAMSEGNPRWLIGIINAITANLPRENVKLPISVIAQQGQLAGLSQAFAEILRAAATGQLRGQGTTAPVYETLEKIGQYFHNRLVLDRFVEDPPMSFVVDDTVDANVENALRIAVNHGALVCYESPDSLGGYASLKGKRFRLAYLLAPEFKLPLRKSKAVSLSTALADRISEPAPIPSPPPPPSAAVPAQGEFPWA
jgi:hypothetical protein